MKGIPVLLEFKEDKVVGGGGNALDLSYKGRIYVNYEEVNK